MIDETTLGVKPHFEGDRQEKIDSLGRSARQLWYYMLGASDQKPYYQLDSGIYMEITAIKTQKTIRKAIRELGQVGMIATTTTKNVYWLNRPVMPQTD